MLTREFRKYWLATAISVIGDQVSVVALSWLVLRLTGNAASLGSVLAVGALPRAVFVLIGGALTDRFQPIRNLMWTRSISMLLLIMLASTVISGHADVTKVMVFSALLGTVAAFSMPAGSAILPQLLGPEQLMQGNGMLIGTLQLGQVLGPIAGGVLIDALSKRGSEGGVETLGIGFAFLADALSFVVSIYLLRRVQLARPYKAQGSSGMFEQIKSGFVHVWRDRPLRYFISYGALINLLIVGPVTVGLPLYAVQILHGGPKTYGSLASLYGFGALAGTVLAGVMPRPNPRFLGAIILGCDVAIGLMLAAVTSSASMKVACILLFSMGTLGGYVMTSVFTWVQARVPRSLIGRIVSILMFSTIGLMPLSSAVAGVLISSLSLQTVLGGAAMVMVAMATLSYGVRSIRMMGVDPGVADISAPPSPSAPEPAG